MVDNNDIQAIRSWLKKQPHLPQTIEDELIASFLSCCDGSLERTKATLDLFFTLRSESPATFKNRDPLAPDIQRTYDLFSMYYLPELTPEGDRVVILRLQNPDPGKFNFTEFVRTFLMGADVRVRTDMSLGGRRGLIFVGDMSGWSLRHLPKFSLSTLSYYMQYIQEAHPVRLKQFHIINAAPILETFRPFFMPFVKNEVASVIYTHPVGSDSIFDYLPKRILPDELGGLAGSEQDLKERWKKKVEAEREWFLKDEWMADESKRVGKRSGELRPAMEGSFRTLSVD